MTSRFKLGDRVVITGQIVKTHADGCTRWLPMRMAAMSGVIVGARTLRNGRTEWIDSEWIDSDGARYFHPEGDPIRAWQVAYSLRIRPLHCLDHQVEHVAIEAPGIEQP
jgi:hypothetical protein